MRKFDYKKDYILIDTLIKGYIKTLKKVLTLLKEYEGNIEYLEALEIICQFEEKYPDLKVIAEQVLNDLLKPVNVEYVIEHKEYPKDASLIGLCFEQDLKQIILLEEHLKNLSIEKWQNLTNFEDIVNGEDFIIVGHAAYQLPGVNDENINDKNNINRPQYLSCSLFSEKELNTFQNEKIVYVTNVNEANYISSSYTDSVTSDYSDESFLTLKTIKVGGEEHHIKVGYSTDYNECVTSIMTPKIVEMLSIKREIEENGEMYNYTNSQTNEIVLDRTTTKIKGVLLISNGIDLLFGEYIHLRNKNLDFKCLNKGLYREKNNQEAYTEEEYKNF